MTNSQPAEPTLVGIDDLKKPEERRAVLVAVRVLGATRAEALDVTGGPEGVVEAMLTLKDGRQAAFEVTILADQAERAVSSLLARAKHSWPVPGRWFWTIDASPQTNLKELKKRYSSIILACEAHGIEDPLYDLRGWDLAFAGDTDLQWLLEGADAKCLMWGFSRQLASSMQNPHVMVVLAGGGGPVDDSLTDFAAELQKAFDAAPHMAEHFTKLARTAADERHLYVPLGDTVLPFSLMWGLAAGNQLPSEPPPVPADITHLWLAPAHSSRVLLWSRTDGWSQHFPYPL